jgi:hypothetical protein
VWFIFFEIVTILWNAVFISFWKEREYRFSSKFGQTLNDKNQNIQKNPKFKGKYKRSLQDDKLNELEPYERTQIIRTFFTFVLCSIGCLLYSILVIYVFQLLELNKFNNELFKVVNPALLLPALLNVILIFAF